MTLQSASTALLERRPPVGAVLGVVAVGAYTGMLAWAMERTSYDVWGALLVIPIVVAVNVPLLRLAVRRESDPWFGRLIVAAFALKVVGSLLRYWVAFGLYGGVADASEYAGYATRVSAWWRQGVFSVEIPQGEQLVGTAFLRLVTAVIFTAIGPTTIGGFVVFSVLGFWGLYMAYRAFRIALPDGDQKRYAALLFLLPSFLFWPSSIGKEAWLMLCIGAIALGTVRLFARRRGAFAVLAAGLVGSAMVRPHVTALAIAALLAGQVLAPRKGGASGIASKVVGVLAIVVAAAVIVQRAADFLGVEDLTSQGVTDAISWAGGQTEQGGSEFTPVPLTSPIGIPASVITVLFRPFPWEAHNLQALFVALEGLLILGVLASSWRRLGRLPSLLRTRPYVVFATVYILLFVYAFSSFGNFGILARQRVLVLPFVLVLAALPVVSERSRRTSPLHAEVSVGAR